MLQGPQRNACNELETRLAPLTELAELRISRTQLETVPASVARFAPSLRLVALDSNALRDASALQRLSLLTSLSLAWNELETVDFVVALVHLKTLSLHHNRLARLPEGIAALTVLEHLDVASNCLTLLPDCRPLPLRLWILERNPGLPRKWQLSLWTRGETRQLAEESHNVCNTQRAIWCVLAGLREALPPELLRLICEVLWRQRYVFFAKG